MIVLIASLIAMAPTFALADGAADETFKIYGRVTYYDGTPVDGGDVNLRHEHSSWIAYATLTDSEGYYELRVRKGKYSALYACKDYGSKNLEFWAWNLQADHDIELNIRIDGLEVYAMNAFNVTGTNSFFVYFRPMSLARSKADGLSRAEREKLALIDIAPRLKVEEVEVEINGEKVAVRDVNMVDEYVADGQTIYGYFIQPKLPEGWRQHKVLRIFVTLTDTETGEKGEGCFFWENPYHKD